MSGVVLLCGGVGGAKLAKGLADILAGDDLTVIVNTGDDFTHLGLHISPDIDTVLYTLSGKANQEQGWGRAGETWSFMEALRSLGGEDWFALGDGDLALHVLRTQRLAAGGSLSLITRDVAKRWGIAADIVPMSDAPVRTMVRTDIGELEFQRYFVEHRCAPKVENIRFVGADEAYAPEGLAARIEAARAVLIAPSNPYLSIDPILAVAELRAALEATTAPVVAISPIVGGKAVKGPTAKIMREFGHDVGNTAVASHYCGLIQGLLIDAGDPSPEGDVTVAVTDTLMIGDEDRRRVAHAALALAETLDRR